MKIGVTVDRDEALSQATELGVAIMQTTLSDPTTWNKPSVPFEGGAAAFREAAAQAQVGLYIHAPYVINVASLNNRIRIPSRKLLQQTINVAAEVGALGVVVHGGHVTAADDPADGLANWRKAVDGLDPQVPIFIENTAGGNNAMTRHLETIARLWDALAGSANLDSVGFCLDTCHAFAAGLDLGSVVDDIRAITGRIDLVHCNDSRSPAGSGADRHANLGQGKIDPAELVALLRQADAPLILETPTDGYAADLAWLADRLPGNA